MAKINGVTVTVNVDTSGNVLTDISNDITSITLNTTRGAQEVTGLDKSALERILLRADATGTMSGSFNADLSHAVFSDVTTDSTARDMTIAYTGITMTMVVVLKDYAIDVGDDGSLTWSVPFAIQNGAIPSWS